MLLFDMWANCGLTKPHCLFCVAQEVKGSLATRENLKSIHAEAHCQCEWMKPMIINISGSSRTCCHWLVVIFDKVLKKKNQWIPTDVTSAFLYLLWVQFVLKDSFCLLENQTQDLLLHVADLMQSHFSVLYADRADLLHVNLCGCMCVCKQVTT